jgi:galactonate dehydratase
MKRRTFLGGIAAAPLGRGGFRVGDCGCEERGESPLQGQKGKLAVTQMKVFGVSLTPDSDRPYVFVKLETNAGVVGWGEATL